MTDAPAHAPRSGAKPFLTDVETLRERARKHLSDGGITKSYRGDVRTKADTALTAADIAEHNLILFGDPGSNKVIAQILDKLPLKWTARAIELAGKSYGTSSHIPVMIYPNPLNPKRYVVLNAGLSGPGPGGPLSSYGDYAVLNIGMAAETKMGIVAHVADSGLFDEDWKLPSRK